MAFDEVRPTSEARRGMATNRTAIREGDRQARRLEDELRELRLRASLTQSTVGQAPGVHRTVISRLEGGNPRVSLAIRFRTAALVGADLRLSAYAQSGPMIRDTAQARLVEAMLESIDPRWSRTLETPLPGLDRRSVDLRLDGTAGIVLCEVESRVGGLEEIIRELHGKRDAIGSTSGRPIHVVLVLPRSRHHLEIVRHHPRTIEGGFPMPSDDVAAALADVEIPWTGDGILWAAVATTRASASRQPATTRASAGRSAGPNAAAPLVASRPPSSPRTCVRPWP
jgi:DNA-binding XRE family transcriptional regulator